MQIENSMHLAERFNEDETKLEKRVNETEAFIAEGEEEIKNLGDEDAELTEAAIGKLKVLTPEEAQELHRIYSLLYAENRY